MLVAIRPSLNARKQNLLLMEMKALRMELPHPNKVYQSATKHLKLGKAQAQSGVSYIGDLVFGISHLGSRIWDLVFGISHLGSRI